MHFRRKYILLLLDGMSYKYQLRLSRITYHLIFYLVYLFIDEIGVLKSLTVTVLMSVSPFIDVAAAKSLQLCLILCNPIDGSPPGSAIPGILQARTLEWVAISFSNA